MIHNPRPRFHTNPPSSSLKPPTTLVKPIAYGIGTVISTQSNDTSLGQTHPIACFSKGQQYVSRVGVLSLRGRNRRKYSRLHSMTRLANIQFNLGFISVYQRIA